MAYRRSLGLALSVMIILIILFAPEYSSAKCYEDKLGIKMQRGSERGKNLLLQSDAKFHWGRKMLQMLDEKPVDAPGKSKRADLDNSFPELETESDRIQAQKKGDTFMRKGNRESEESRFPNGSDEEQQQHSRKSMANEHYITKKYDESKAFLEAADEVANLMRKDYKGADRPRRKPPINNNEPRH